MNHWALLAIAVVAEVAGSVSLRLSDGFTRWIPVATVCVLYLVSFWLEALVMRTLGIGITYSVWAGAGMALSAIVGIFYFGESAHLMKIGGIAIISIGVVIVAFAPE